MVPDGAQRDDPPIPYGRQSLDDEDIRAAVDVLRGNWLTQGPKIAAFEEELARVCGALHAVAFSSGTAALHAAAFAAQLAPGDELVTSAITFPASANCAAYVGAVPRFADVDPTTWNISAETVEQTLTEKTAAVVPVHFAGLPAPVREIRAAVGDDVTIIEDASHALGASSADGPVGSCAHSDMATFSFHPVKAIAMGEGGAVTTNDADLRDRLLMFRNHGIAREAGETRSQGGWWYEQHELGFNYRVTDIQCALGISQLKKLPGFIKRRNEIASMYRGRLSALNRLEMPPSAAPTSVHAYHLFVVRHRGGAAARRGLYDELRNRGILCQVHYIPVYRHPYYAERFGYAPGLCPQAEDYYAGCLSLPCFPALSDRDVERVATAVWETVAQ